MGVVSSSPLNPLKPLAMALMTTNRKVIVNDALLDYVLDFSYLSPCPWVWYEHRSLDWVALLCLLLALATIFKVSRANTTFVMQYSMLRLASYDVELVLKKTCAAKEMKYVF